MATYEQILMSALHRDMQTAARTFDVDRIRFLLGVHRGYITSALALDGSRHSELFLSTLEDEFDIAAAESGADREPDSQSFERWCEVNGLMPF